MKFKVQSSKFKVVRVGVAHAPITQRSSLSLLDTGLVLC